MKNYSTKEGDVCTFQILFTSDIHGAFRDYNYVVDKETNTTGFSKIAALMRREKDSFNGTTFILDTGDIIQGNGTSVLINNDAYKPFPLLAAFDALGYDMVSIGNHEFNFGIPALLRAFEGYKGEKLCGNVFDRENNLLEGFQAYTVKTLQNGLRVAFIGMVSPNVDRWDKSHFEAAQYTANDAAEETKKIIKRLKAEDLADIFILLGHMHIDNELDRRGSGANDVVKMNPEIDLFLGAHFHLATGKKKEQCILNNSVKFVENKSSAANFGKILMTAIFENGRWRIPNRIGSYEESDVKTDIIEIINDPTVEQATAAAHEYVQSYMRNTVIGCLRGGPLVPPPQILNTHEVILQPTPLISLMTKIIQKYTSADIVAAAPNDYTVNCEEGPITQGKISQMYVYDNNTIYTLKMTGAQILQWMEWSNAFFGATIHGVPDLVNPAVNLETDLTIPYGTRKIYLHDKFGGIQYEVDLTKPVGSRINVLSMADGSPFDLEKTYTVAASNYRATTNLLIHSRDGIFKDEKSPAATLLEMDVKSPKGYINMLDWIVEYIQEQPAQAITNECLPNWKLVNLDWDMALRERTIEKINKKEIPFDYKVPVRKIDI